MKKFVALIIRKKANNEWENGESDFLQALSSVYKQL